MTDSNFFICILAGGSGERFWPMSRQSLPKHLISLFGPTTLLEQAVHRALRIVPKEQIFVLTNEAQVAQTCAILSFLPPSQIIAEPAKRDTAPAAALATSIALVSHPNAIIALMPADALIRDEMSFSRQIKQGFIAASQTGSFITLAIHPIYPATGFGYIELGGASSIPSFYQVARFVEKPNENQAREYLATGKFGWNAGIFIWTAERFLYEAERLQPSLADFVKNYPKDHKEAFGYIKSTFISLPKISIDYALMEQASSVLTAWAEFDWDDVGAWTALPTHFGKDEERNTLHGNVVVVDSSHNIVISSGRTIALYGVNDLVVVETTDAVLVCPRSKAQEIKKLQEKLPNSVM